MQNVLNAQRSQITTLDLQFRLFSSQCSTMPANIVIYYHIPFDYTIDHRDFCYLETIFAVNDGSVNNSKISISHWRLLRNVDFLQKIYFFKERSLDLNLNLIFDSLVKLIGTLANFSSKRLGNLIGLLVNKLE